MLNNTLAFYFVLFLILLCLAGRKSLLNALRLFRWRTSLNIRQHQRRFNALYAFINGFYLSRSGREHKDSPDLIYGEIEFEPFIALLSCCNIHPKTQFYDLGSGTGKAVIAAAMVYPIQRAVGIELLENLHQCAEQQKNKLAQCAAYTKKTANINFICNNFLDCSIEQADLVYINATAFIGEHWTAITQHLTQLKTGSQCICISKKLISNQFQLIRCTKLAMSWGVVFAYIYQKKKAK